MIFRFILEPVILHRGQGAGVRSLTRPGSRASSLAGRRLFLDEVRVMRIVLLKTQVDQKKETVPNKLWGLDF